MRRILALCFTARMALAIASHPLPGPAEGFHGFAIHRVEAGSNTVQVLVPSAPAKGQPWVLAAELYPVENPTVGRMGRVQLELVRRGFHVVALSLGNTFGAPDAIARYDAVHRTMTREYGLASRIALMGLSREGLAISRWAAANPGKVGCLYLDKAVCDFKSWPGGRLGVGPGSPDDWRSLQAAYGFKTESEAMSYPWNPIDLAPKLVAHGVAILYLAGETDVPVPWSENGARMQQEYKRLGGTFESILHTGEGHHPHGPPDAGPVVDFISRHQSNASPVAVSAPSRATSRWKPEPGHIMTRWADQVNPSRALPEYPRPQMTRKDWINLNGLWDYAIQPMNLPMPGQFTGRILVPFPVESALSGVKTPVWKDERLWYRRTFRAPRLGKEKRLLLHFGAVDWEARVFVNGTQAGEHRGGYDSFSFDITDSIHPGADNELVVAVLDASGSGQAVGKQNYNKFHKPASLAYTACSGIWQTVWMETVNSAHIEGLKLNPDLAGACLRITVHTRMPAPDVDAEIIAYDGLREVARIHGRPGVEITLPIQHPRPWSPSDPFLYTLKVRWASDEVGSYFGMRDIALGKDAAGRTTMLLNGKPLFQAGTLDQGYWPDGNYTAPTDEALRWDLEQMKRLGFNMVRKHMKIESERWFHWCDRLGLLVWQDMPSGGAGHGGDRGLEGRRGDPAVAMQFEAELRAMVEQHGNHPSVIMWVLFNEAWGQYDTARLTRMLKDLDPTRIVNSASGWADVGTGDVNDRHVYPGPECPEPEPARASVLGEFGGLGLATKGHTWVGQSWGYKGVTDERSFTERYAALWQDVWRLHATQGLGAAVYTQWTDIETECNGLYTYDRKRLKLDAQRARAAHRGP